MRGKTHILLHLFAKDTVCMRGKTHVGLLLYLSGKDTTVELMYINMHVLGKSHLLGTDSYHKDKAHVWKSCTCSYRMPYL